jgi:hypothetical protein
MDDPPRSRNWIFAAPLSHSPTAMDLKELTQILTGLGCPPNQAGEMAAQLAKRARQLATQKGRTETEALDHLLGLMRQAAAARPPQT